MTFAASKNIQQPNNFNMLRLILALYIFLVHFVAVHDFDTNLLFIPGPDCVRGFFVISGFLIYSSYCRSSSLKSFFIKRGRRILPSYFFVVIFFAVALAFVSTLPAGDYFGGHWLRYLVANLTFTNYSEPTLPGVFADNHISAVNGSLWTIKVEIMCYIALPLLLFLCRKTKVNPFLFFGVVILLSIAYTFFCNHMLGVTGDPRYVIYARQIGGQMAYFVLGMMLYELLHIVMNHRYKLLAAGIVAYIIVYFVPELSDFLKPFAIALIIIPLAFIGRWGYFLGSTDISYDFYLIHFPVVQVVACYGLVGLVGAVPAMLLSLVVVLILASLSWHFVGKRFLSRNRVTSQSVPTGSVKT